MVCLLRHKMHVGKYICFFKKTAHLCNQLSDQETLPVAAPYLPSWVATVITRKTLD